MYRETREFTKFDVTFYDPAKCLPKHCVEGRGAGGGEESKNICIIITLPSSVHGSNTVYPNHWAGRAETYFRAHIK